MKVMMTALAMDPTMWLPSFEGQNSRGRIPGSIAANMSMTVGKTMASPDPGFDLHQTHEENRRFAPISKASPA